MAVKKVCLWHCFYFGKQEVIIYIYRLPHESKLVYCFRLQITLVEVKWDCCIKHCHCCLLHSRMCPTVQPKHVMWPYLYITYAKAASHLWFVTAGMLASSANAKTSTEQRIRRWWFLGKVGVWIYTSAHFHRYATDVTDVCCCSWKTGGPADRPDLFSNSNVHKVTPHSVQHVNNDNKLVQQAMWCLFFRMHEYKQDEIVWYHFLIRHHL